MGLSYERLDPITASNYKITPELSFCGTKTREWNNRIQWKLFKAR